MKRLTVFTILLCLLLTACGPKYPEPPEKEDIRPMLVEYAEEELKETAEKLGVDDLSVDIQFKKFEVTPAAHNTDGWVSYAVRDRLVSPTIEEKILNGTLTDEELAILADARVYYEDMYWNDYWIFGYSVFAVPMFLTSDGEEFALAEGVIAKDGDEIVYLSDDADLAYDIAVGDSIKDTIDDAIDNATVSGKPYVGMSVDKIDRTVLGPHDKTDYNYNHEDGVKHRCTLYCWMEGSRCIFIARVQDDLGKVITVEDTPAGSYFGN